MGRQLRRYGRMHLLQTVAFVSASVTLLSLFSFMIFGLAGLSLSVAAVSLFLVAGLRISPRLALGLHQASPMARQVHRELYQLTESLAKRVAFPGRIHLYSVPDPTLNAFSTGSRQSPCIALSQGLLSHLSERELAGVLAHEIAHLANGDLKLMVLSHLVGRVMAFFAAAGQLLVWVNLPFILSGEFELPLALLLLIGLAPGGMQLIHLKLSRVREYNADIVAVQMTGDPDGLTAALLKIGHVHRTLLAKISSKPSTPSESEPREWLSTHPPTEARIRRLHRISTSLDQQQTLPHSA